MEGLLLIVGLIVCFASSIKKKNQKDQEHIRQIQAQTARRMQERAARMARTQSASKPMPAPPVVQAQPVLSPMTAEGESALQAASPEAAFRGSMQMTSTEGECVCDPELEHVRQTQLPKEEKVYANEIGAKGLVDFSARGIMQAVVMNEILTRPAQRTRRLR